MTAIPARFQEAHRERAEGEIPQNLWDDVEAIYNALTASARNYVESELKKRGIDPSSSQAWLPPFFADLSEDLQCHYFDRVTAFLEDAYLATSHIYKHTEDETFGGDPYIWDLTSREELPSTDDILAQLRELFGDENVIDGDAILDMGRTLPIPENN